MAISMRSGFPASLWRAIDLRGIGICALGFLVGVLALRPGDPALTDGAASRIPRSASSSERSSDRNGGPQPVGDRGARDVSDALSEAHRAGGVSRLLETLGAMDPPLWARPGVTYHSIAEVFADPTFTGDAAAHLLAQADPDLVPLLIRALFAGMDRRELDRLDRATLDAWFARSEKLSSPYEVSAAEVYARRLPADRLDSLLAGLLSDDPANFDSLHGFTNAAISKLSAERLAGLYAQAQQSGTSVGFERALTIAALSAGDPRSVIQALEKVTSLNIDLSRGAIGAGFSANPRVALALVNSGLDRERFPGEVARYAYRYAVENYPGDLLASGDFPGGSGNWSDDMESWTLAARYPNFARSIVFKSADGRLPEPLSGILDSSLSTLLREEPLDTFAQADGAAGEGDGGMPLLANIEEVVTTLLDEGPVSPELVSRLTGLPSEVRSGLLQNLLLSDPQTALAIAGISPGVFDIRDIESAARESGSTESAAVWSLYMAEIARGDPSGVLRYRKLTDRIASGLLWNRGSPLEAAEFLRSLPPALRNPAGAAVFDGWRNADPQGFAGWIAGLDPADLLWESLTGHSR